MYNFKRASEVTDTLSNGVHQSVQEIKTNFLNLELIIPEENSRFRFFKSMSSDSQNIRKSYLWVGIKNGKKLLKLF